MGSTGVKHGRSADGLGGESDMGRRHTARRCGLGRSATQQPGEHQKKAPVQDRGRESLIAVITLRLLLREEKQGTTTLRLSFKNQFSALER
ncbi:hypothetical protein ASC95_29185 [Pelomonas sp. Root1217]|nr:hypothetical protein ASC95_29185 [Pelomonas sp. Root1217]